MYYFLFNLYFTCFFFFNDTATTEIYTLSLHDALPIYVDDLRARGPAHGQPGPGRGNVVAVDDHGGVRHRRGAGAVDQGRSGQDADHRSVLPPGFRGLAHHSTAQRPRGRGVEGRVRQSTMKSFAPTAVEERCDSMSS